MQTIFFSLFGHQSLFEALSLGFELAKRGQERLLSLKVGMEKGRGYRIIPVAMNIYLANFLIGALAFLLAYFLGSIPNGVIIGKVFFHKDPRDYYSGNSGGSNVGRVFGKKIGVLVIVLDALKSMLALFIPFLVLTYVKGLQPYLYWGDYYAAPFYYWGATVFALLGHCFPIYLHFQGGKAVASYVGVGIFFSYVEVVVFAVSFFVALFKKKFVSLASILASSLTALTMLIICLVMYGTGTLETSGACLTWSFGAPGYLVFGFESTAALLITTLILILRHLPNIKRLKEGKENTVKWIK